MRDKIEEFAAKCSQMVAEHQAKNFPNITTTPSVRIEWGKRYARLVRIDATIAADGKERIISRSAWAFIDMGNGDILKPASFKAPAKHARGNLLDKHNGMESIGPYGPAYLR